MRDNPYGRPLSFPRQGFTLAGSVLLFGLRVLLLIALRMVRPFVMLPLLIAAVGGMCVTLGFGYAGHWHDAARAAAATLTAAIILGLYSRLADWLDPGHFGRHARDWRSRW